MVSRNKPKRVPVKVYRRAKASKNVCAVCGKDLKDSKTVAMHILKHGSNIVVGVSSVIQKETSTAE